MNDRYSHGRSSMKQALKSDSPATCRTQVVLAEIVDKGESAESLRWMLEAVISRSSRSLLRTMT
jgi:hypothetical protein